MKKIKNLFLNGCAYSVLITILFYCFALIFDFSDAKMGIWQFLLIFLFGLIISGADFILKYAPWHILIRYSLHYLTLFLAFSVIFIINGNIAENGGSAILSSAVIFTFFYLIILTLILVIRHSFESMENKLVTHSKKSIDNKTDTHSNKSKKSDTKNDTYTPRFK